MSVLGLLVAVDPAVESSDAADDPWSFGGVSFLGRAASVLAASGRVDSLVAVVADAARGPVLRSLARAGDAVPPLVVESERTLWSTLRSAAARDAWVVVHDVRCVATPDVWVAEVVDLALRERRPVLSTRTVADTVQWVDADGWIVGTADRDRCRLAASPLVVPARALLAADACPGGREPGRSQAHPLGDAGCLDPVSLARDLLATGTEVLTATAPAEAFPVTSTAELRLAEALTAVRGSVGDVR